MAAPVELQPGQTLCASTLFVVAQGSRSRLGGQRACPLCATTLAGGGAARRHERSEHHRDAFRCASCGKCCSCSEDLRRHFRSTGHSIPIAFQNAAEEADDWEVIQSTRPTEVGEPVEGVQGGSCAPLGSNVAGPRALREDVGTQLPGSAPAAASKEDVPGGLCKDRESCVGPGATDPEEDFDSFLKDLRHNPVGGHEEVYNDTYLEDLEDVGLGFSALRAAGQGRVPQNPRDQAVALAQFRAVDLAIAEGGAVPVTFTREMLDFGDEFFASGSSEAEDEAPQVSGTSETRGNLGVAPELQHWPGEQLNKEALTAQERRKACEERFLGQGAKDK